MQTVSTDPSETETTAGPVGSAHGDEMTEPTAPDAAAEMPAAGVPLEPAESAIQRLEEELAELRDRHARLAAEFDNYRKRVLREKAELGDRAQAGLVGRLIEALDDLQRVTASDAAATPTEALRGGIDAVEKKLWKELAAAGLEKVDPAGQPFDPTVHEAVSMIPAGDPSQEQTVSATFQAGYRFKGLLVRPARVQVFSGPGSH